MRGLVDERGTNQKTCQKRYGELAKNATSCCCSPSTETDKMKLLGYTQKELETIPEETISLGCGNPVALASLKEGETVLDLGSGAGFDCFVAAKKVGEKGKVIGVDMTPEMVQKAKAIAEKHGYNNVEFRQGEIEKLPVEDSSIDAIISNCVINLSPDKSKVFSEAYRVLKQGGRLMVSDIVIEGKLPKKIRKDLEAWAGCVAGAMEKSAYLNAIRNAGFKEVKIVSETSSDCEISEEFTGKIVSAKIEAKK
ncbi:arsenite methyltransferase [Candidatus Bathyarchaeota archaeon]|nr:arsenite methyltransferase [Candidatus Bathyarchaeota archaeon]